MQLYKEIFRFVDTYDIDIILKNRLISYILWYKYGIPKGKIANCMGKRIHTVNSYISRINDEIRFDNNYIINLLAEIRQKFVPLPQEDVSKSNYDYLYSEIQKLDAKLDKIIVKLNKV